MGKEWKHWQTLFFLGSKITTDGDCSHEIKRRLLLGRKVMTNLESESEVTQSCPTLCNQVDYSLPSFSVHGILQARVLEWVTISFSRGSSWPRNRTRVSCIGGRRFNLWTTREALTNLESILKSRNITLPTMVHLVKAMIFPVVMYGCESWTIKRAEHRRIDAFELWYWRSLLRVPWTTRRSTSSS